MTILMMYKVITNLYILLPALIICVCYQEPYREVSQIKVVDHLEIFYR